MPPAVPLVASHDHPPPTSRLHGYLLAGGQSSRMGTDKARLLLDGLTLLERATRTLAAICRDVTVVGRAHLSLPHLPDAAPGIGPVGGVASALRDLHTRHAAWALFLPVDVPLLPAGLLQALASLWLANPRTRIAFPIADDRPQPVISLVHVAALPAFDLALQTGQHRLRAVLESAVPPENLTRTTLTLQPAEILADTHPIPWRPTPAERRLQPLWFGNCNTPAELARLQQALDQARST